MIRQRAKEIGFTRIGIAPAQAFPEHVALKEWLAQGRHGEMAYLARSAEKRMNPLEVMPEARSVIVATMLYNTDFPKSTECPDSDRGWIARYAWGDDYHEVVGAKMKELEEAIRSALPDDERDAFLCRSYVDTGPTMDKVLAKYAGLGWIGKNTCLIHPKDGSYTVIAMMLTNVALTPDPIINDHCGSCTACIEACPTAAITAPYQLDARKCISYLTIEHKGDLPADVPTGNHILGCDICQDVCPWNRKAPVTNNPHFQPRNGFFNPKLSDFESKLDEYPSEFAKSPLKRPKKEGLWRNVTRAMTAIRSTWLQEP